MSTTDVDTIRVEVREMGHNGIGVAEPLSWANTDAIKRPRITFTLELEDWRELIRKFVEGQRAVHYDLPVEKILGYEMPPVGSLGWTAGRG